MGYGHTEIRGALLALEADFIQTQAQIAARQRWNAAHHGKVCHPVWQDEAETRIQQYRVRWHKTARNIQQNVIFWTSRSCNKRHVRQSLHQSY